MVVASSVLEFAADDPAIERALRALYHAAPATTLEPSLRYSIRNEGDGFTGRGPGKPPFGPASLEDAWSFVEWRATEDILRTEQRFVCLHAAGIQLGGLNVLLIGASGSGKSTTAAHLMAGGCRAWGDDLVCFAPSERRFSAFPRSLKLDDKTLSDLDLVKHIVDGSGEGMLLAPPVAYVSPAAFRADWEAPPGLADAVVLLDSERHTGQVSVEPVSEGAAAIMATQSIIAGGYTGMEHTRLMLKVLEALTTARAWRASGAGAGNVARAIEAAVRHA